MNQFTFGYGQNQGLNSLIGLNEPVTPQVTGGEFLRYLGYAALGVIVLRFFMKTIK